MLPGISGYPGNTGDMIFMYYCVFSQKRRPPKFHAEATENRDEISHIRRPKLKLDQRSPGEGSPLITFVITNNEKHALRHFRGNGIWTRIWEIESELEKQFSADITKSQMSANQATRKLSQWGNTSCDMYLWWRRSWSSHRFLNDDNCWNLLLPVKRKTLQLK